MTRREEIRTIHKKHRLFYELLGGLVLLIIGIFIGAMFFSGENPKDDYPMNLFTEAMGIAATVFVVNRWYVHRDRERLKRRLVREAGSRSNDLARSAIGQLHDEGWLKGDDGLLREASLSRANWENMEGLHRANLQDANLRNANLKNASLSEANLQEARLFGANLENANLSDANLQRAKLPCARLENANLSRTNLQNAELDFTILQGASLNKANLQEAIMIGADLQGAHLYKADLQGANLIDVKSLKEVKYLKTANLEEANLSAANLQGMDLENAKLRRAKLQMTDLQGVNFYGADLRETDLRGANLRGVWIRRREIRIQIFSGEEPPVDSDEFEEVHPATALQGAILPNGERYTEKTEIDKFIFPTHSEFSQTVKEINDRIRKKAELDDLPES